MKAEEKIIGGKLVCVEVWAEGTGLRGGNGAGGASSGRVGRVKISGDFFLHPEDAIDALESSFIGLPLESEPVRLEAAITKSLEDAGAELIGVTANDLARLFAKAVSG